VTEETRMTVRLPNWAVDFLDAAGKENFTSRNAEIVRSIRERMSAATEGQIGVGSSAAASSNNAALAGGASITQDERTV
jgi:hypothetical protein